MLNPARELHVIVSDWRDVLAANDGSQSIMNSRGGEAGPAETMRAFVLLQAVERHVDQWEANGTDVSVQRRTIDALTVSLLAFPNTWQQATRSDAAYPQWTLDGLEMMAQLIDFAGEGHVTPLVAVKVSEFLALVQEALDGDGSLDPVFREYMESLIGMVADAVEHGDVVQLREDLQHLWFAVFAAEEISEDDGKWRDVARRFGWETFTQTISSVLGGVVTKMITGG